MESKIRFNVARIVPKDNDGRVIPLKIAPILRDIILKENLSNDWAMKAYSINAYGEVDLRLDDFRILEGIILAHESKFRPEVKAAIIKYLNELNENIC